MRLGEILQWRIVQERTVRDLAAEIGISASTLSRIERGEVADAATFMRLLSWVTERRAKPEEAKAPANCDDPGSEVQFAGGGLDPHGKNHSTVTHWRGLRLQVQARLKGSYRPAFANHRRQRTETGAGAVEAARQHQFADVGKPRGLARWSAAPAGGMGTQPESSTAPGVAITPIRHTSIQKGTKWKT